MSDHCELLRVIRHNRCLDLGNGSNKFGNHCSKTYAHGFESSPTYLVITFPPTLSLNKPGTFLFNPYSVPDGWFSSYLLASKNLLHHHWHLWIINRFFAILYIKLSVSVNNSFAFEAYIGFNMTVMNFDCFLMVKTAHSQIDWFAKSQFVFFQMHSN